MTHKIAGSDGLRAYALLVFLLALSLAGCSQSSGGRATTWDPRAAATYLDQREDWWARWPGSARDHDTFCISCHTVLPYALARSRLDEARDVGAPSAMERRVYDDVVKRVRLWDQTLPYYTDQKNGPHKSEQSRGTEAVLNALILATEDAHTGHLSPDTKSAFDHMWERQAASGDVAGAWAWLDFDLEPWEMHDAQYFGAAMAALAVGTAPENYRATAAIQEPLRRLRGYLVRDYPDQPLHQRLALLWAATALPGLLAPAGRQAIIDAALRAQNSDGGWSLYALAPSYRRGARFLRLWSDGYATGFVTFVLQRAGVPRDNAQVRRGLSWLAHHQEPEGLWAAYSINQRMNWSTPKGRFMSDAATAYAVLALTASRTPASLEPLPVRQARR
jgi:squalene-hopene/tetraprenyl-beta-curcumene cyclase